MERNFEKPNKHTEPQLGDFLWLALTALLLCYPFISDIVLSMKNTGGFLEGFVLFFAPVVLFPFFLFKTIRGFNLQKKWRIWLPIILGVLFPIYIMLCQKNVIQTELKLNGVKTKGKLTLDEERMKDSFRPVSRKKGEKNKDFEERRRVQREQAKMNSKPFICEYKVNGEVFSQVVYLHSSETTKPFSTDSIEIVYSKVYPKIFLYGDEADLN